MQVILNAIFVMQFFEFKMKYNEPEGKSSRKGTRLDYFSFREAWSPKPDVPVLKT